MKQFLQLMLITVTVNSAFTAEPSAQLVKIVFVQTKFSCSNNQNVK